ncbi:twitch domain-containing radical SAM protein [bacterium]|nr:twitch domain-containing radical SAM protein [bacterium]
MITVPHDKFCVLPWVSLEASPIGTLRPCCLADDEIVDNDGKKFELSTADFVDVQTSNHMRDLRTQFIEGHQPKTCRKCWNEEDAGRTSKRMHTLNRLKHVLKDEQWNNDAKPLMFLDLKLGNICNLKCRICGSWSSSQFAGEEISFLPRAEQKSSHAYKMLRAGAWPRENTHFWSQIDSVLTDIRYIEFTGGEPFMIDQHFDMLQGIVDRGIAHNVEIHYNTNGTLFPDRGPEIWKHFKTVEIAFSIDDVGKRFDYQRTNADWAVVLDNITSFQYLKDQMPNLQLQCCSTVNVFNVRYLDELAHWIALQRFDFVYWNMMHDAWYFSISRLPVLAKEQIANYLGSCSVPEQFQTEFGRIVEFMNRGESSDGEETIQQIQKLDQRRHQDLTKIAPELASILEYAKT